jgi:hypothetical protein
LSACKLFVFNGLRGIAACKIVITKGLRPNSPISIT